MKKFTFVLISLLAGLDAAVAQDGRATYPNMAPLEQYLMADRNAEIELAHSAAPASISGEVMNKIEPLPRDLEIQLALSALPPHLRDKATVYVLNPAKGFEVARKGTSEFHALVARTGDDTFRSTWPLTEYRDDILYPISFDKAGTKAQMRIFFDAAEMQAKGTPADELKKIMKDRLKTGYYKAPERAGISYMLSPILRTYYNPDESDGVVTVNFPHVMYYAPNVSNEDIGAGEPLGPYPIVILHGHHGYMIQPLGLTERAALNKEYEEMLGRLCKIKEVWCLPKEGNLR
ncbi:MAG: hypothetical protein ACREOO_13265 [bacterium]